MGIYFESTTDEQDAEYIKQGINLGLIVKKEDGSYEKIDTVVNYDKGDNGTFTTTEHTIWIPNKEGKVNINGINGILTERGIMYIMYCLSREGKVSTTY